MCKTTLPYRWAIPVGLLINSLAMLLHHTMHLSDFVTGTLQGAGIGIMLGALIKMNKLKKQAQP